MTNYINFTFTAEAESRSRILFWEMKNMKPESTQKSNTVDYVDYYRWYRKQMFFLKMPYFPSLYSDFCSVKCLGKLMSPAFFCRVKSSIPTFFHVLTAYYTL